MWQDRGADEDEEQWALSRFVPLVQELVEDLAAGTLSPDDFPPVRAPDGRHAGPPGCKDKGSVKGILTLCRSPYILGCRRTTFRRCAPETAAAQVRLAARAACSRIWL